MFDGNCEEAFNFYKDALEGEITMMTPFEGSPMEVSDDQKRKIMHAELVSDQITLMGADPTPDHKTEFGNNVYLSINFSDETEQKGIFDALADGGTVLMAL